MNTITEIRKNKLPVDKINISTEHFNGHLLQMIFGTIIDLKEKHAYCARFYLCEKNVIIKIFKYTKNRDHIIYALDRTDNLQKVDIDHETLQTAVNQTGSSKALNVKSTSPICGIAINNKFLFICNIEGGSDVDLRNWISKLYLVSTDYCTKTENTIIQIKNILTITPFDHSLPVHGLTGKTAYLNQYLTIAFLILFLPLILYLVYLSTKDNQLLLIVIIGIPSYIAISNYTRKGQ